MRTRDLCLSGLRVVVLSCDRRSNDGNSDEELKRSQVEHDFRHLDAIRFGY